MSYLLESLASLVFGLLVMFVMAKTLFVVFMSVLGLFI